MKLTTKTFGEAELPDSEVQEAFRLYAKQKPGVLLDAVNAYLKDKGFVAKKIAHSVDTSGAITVKAQIESFQSEIERTLFAKAETPDKKDNSGFKRKNVGFYSTLIEYLQDERKKGNKEVTFEDAYKDLLFFFPDLKHRNCYIYCSDTRQQKTKGFYFNTKKKVLGLR